MFLHTVVEGFCYKKARYDCKKGSAKVRQNSSQAKLYLKQPQCLDCLCNLFFHLRKHSRLHPQAMAVALPFVDFFAFEKLKAYIGGNEKLTRP